MNTSIIFPAGADVITRDPSPSGWGEKYKRIVIDKPAVQIEIDGPDGKPACCIRVKENGNLIVTNYRGMYEMLHGGQVVLTNTRPWDKS